MSLTLSSFVSSIATLFTNESNIRFIMSRGGNENARKSKVTVTILSPHAKIIALFTYRP